VIGDLGLGRNTPKRHPLALLGIDGGGRSGSWGAGAARRRGTRSAPRSLWRKGFFNNRHVGLLSIYFTSSFSTRTRMGRKTKGRDITLPIRLSPHRNARIALPQSLSYGEGEACP
jgi:hypothetical protein